MPEVTPGSAAQRSLGGSATGGTYESAAAKTAEPFAPTVAQESCVFCRRIAAGEYDDGDVWAVTFEPLNPVTPGHRLVVPRIHTPDAVTTPYLTGRVMEYASKITASRSCNLITSVGAAATQTVMHLHVHIVPRREGDGLHLPWTGQEVANA